MIKTYRYGAEQSSVPNSLVKENYSASELLRIKGPTIPITITHPPELHEILTSQGKTIPRRTVQVIIDTGASMSIVSSEIVEQLELINIGFQTIWTIHDIQEQYIFPCQVLFPWGNGNVVTAASSALHDIGFIIGRDLMENWHITYNGAEGSITICE